MTRYIRKGPSIKTLALEARKDLCHIVLIKQLFEIVFKKTRYHLCMHHKVLSIPVPEFPLPQ